MTIYSQDGMDNCEQSLHGLADNPGWLILYTHDVRETPSAYGSTVEDFTRIVSLCTNYGFEVLTVNDAAAKIGVRPSRR